MYVMHLLGALGYQGAGSFEFRMVSMELLMMFKEHSKGNWFTGNFRYLCAFLEDGCSAMHYPLYYM